MKYSKYRLEDGIEDNAVKIFVYREPLERVLSFYLNKIVDQKNAEDALGNFSSVMGIHPDECTLYDFLTYLQKGMDVIDVHLIPQKAHLFEQDYFPISIDSLKLDVSRFIGQQRAEKFFGVLKNSTSSGDTVPGGVDKSSKPEKLYEYEAAMLREMRRSGIDILKNDLIFDDLEQTVRSIYETDYGMIEEIGHQSP